MSSHEPATSSTAASVADPQEELSAALARRPTPAPPDAEEDDMTMMSFTSCNDGEGGGGEEEDASVQTDTSLILLDDDDDESVDSECGDGDGQDEEEYFDAAAAIAPIGVDDDDDDNNNNNDVGLDDDETEENEQQEEQQEDDDDSSSIVYQLLQNPDSYKDPITMSLSDEERRWAIAVRDAMENSTQLEDKVSDFECAQYGIACQGDVADAIRRMESIQLFRTTHKIAVGGGEEMVQQGTQVLEEFLQQQPGYLLELDIDSTNYNAIHALDIGAIIPQNALAADHPKGVDYPLRIFLTGWYYIFVASNPILSTVQRGTYNMMDFGSFGWNKWNLELQIQFAGQVFRDYPITWNKNLCFNTGLVANLCWSILKPFYPKHYQQSLQLGCKIPRPQEEEGQQQQPQQQQQHYSENLSDKYLQPTMDDAYRRLLKKVHNMLALRAKHEKLFRL